MSGNATTGGKQGGRLVTVAKGQRRAVDAELRRLMDNMPGRGGRVSNANMRTLYNQAARNVAKRR